MLTVDSVRALPRRSLHLPSPSAVVEQQAAGEPLNGGEAWDGNKVGTAHPPHNRFYIFITVILKTLLGAVRM